MREAVNSQFHGNIEQQKWLGSGDFIHFYLLPMNFNASIFYAFRKLRFIRDCYQVNIFEIEQH